jgi:signal transduction histidine kinase
MLQLLLIDPDIRHRRAFLWMVQHENLGYEVVTAGSVDEAIDRLYEQSFDLVISELTLPDGDMLDLLKRYGRAVPFIIVTGGGDATSAVNMLKAGAYDYVVKERDGHHLNRLPMTIEQAVYLRHIEREEAEQRRFANALRDTALALNSALDLDDILTRIQRNMQKVIPFDCSSIMRVEEGQLSVINSYRQPETQRQNLKQWHGKLSVNPFFQTVITTRQPQTRSEIILKRDSQTSHLIQLSGDCLCAPVMIDDEVVALFTLQRGASKGFTPMHIERLTVFANQVATALENASLHQRAIENALTEERHRLARDLHDSVTQTLFAASVISESLIKNHETDPNMLAQGLQDLNQLTRDALLEMRALLVDLRPDTGEIGNLDAHLKQLTDNAKQRANIEIKLITQGSSQPPSEVKKALFRIAQESLNNIVKHACAKMVRVSLSRHPSRTELDIYDDGIGFNLSDPRAKTHMGLIFMQERADEAGIHLDIQSQQHHGTRIRAVWSNKG